jgi:hypothetical protein
MMWAASYLKDKIFARFESYIIYYLEKGAISLCDKIVINVINIIGHYLALLLQSFGDLDKLRIVKLRLFKLIQIISVSEYLTKFI